MNLFQKIAQAIFRKKTIIKATKYTRKTKSDQSKSTIKPEKKPKKSKFSLDLRKKAVMETLAGTRQGIVAKKYGISQSTLSHWMTDYRLRVKAEETQVKNVENLQSLLKDMSLEDVCVNF